MEHFVCRRHSYARSAIRATRNGPVSSGRGRVYSFVVYHKAFHPSFADEVPYVVAIIALDEGPHLITNVIKCNPDEVYCNMPVEIIWEERTNEVTIPMFTPAGMK